MLTHNLHMLLDIQETVESFTNMKIPKEKIVNSLWQILRPQPAILTNFWDHISGKYQNDRLVLEVFFSFCFWFFTFCSVFFVLVLEVLKDDKYLKVKI